MPRSLPKPAPYLKDHEIRQAIEPLYNAFYANEGEISALQEAAIAAAQAAADAADDAAAAAQAVADLAAERVGTRDYAEVLTEETTTSGSYVDLSTVGPAATIEVETGDMGFAIVQYEGKVSTTASGEQAQAALFEPTDYSSGRALLPTANYPAATSYSTLTTDVLPLILTAGTRTFTLKYQVGNAVFATASFKNRKLWVWTVSGFS